MTYERVLAPLDSALPGLEALYLDFHRHPELAYAETRTAAELARRLTEDGFEVHTGIGRTGVAGVLRNGEGPTVLLRADMDALPVEERTGLPYASTARGVDAEGREVPVMHACGHDMHVTWLSGAASLLSAAREHWSGTLVAVFQPGEEAGAGALRMLGDGLFDLVGAPDFVFGQHLAPAPAGWVLTRPGVLMAASDSLRVTLHGRGGHGSRPETTVDPAVLAASVVLKLQTIVSRETAATEPAVVTVGSMHVGTTDNVIADDAVLEVNTRAFDEAGLLRLRAAIGRIAQGEAATAGAPEPAEVELLRSYPVTDNDAALNGELAEAFLAHFGPEATLPAPLVTGSEDFGEFGRAAGAPSVFWLVGGHDPEEVITAMTEGRFERDIPSNHSPRFAPVLHPTLRAGVETLVIAALSRMAHPGVR
ncbi:amidohydrolase [Amycolatopsis sp. PS_44_ISF1]|uniref:amidohydrolase n=1 Tax=Amycolatopsis sp. PS_44_ISF1 TaxID=2974917 RepID=UPI0028DF3FA0|nr:amidohydrolase [Amycolatopsis sp. PS_44_ISF1]MDT8914144.1 amidohydrolase [Amycolatopsis sp. PS_44_ISF1]